MSVLSNTILFLRINVPFLNEYKLIENCESWWIRIYSELIISHEKKPTFWSMIEESEKVK